MSASTSLEESHFPGGRRKGESITHERSKLLVLTSESYTVHRHFLIDLLPNVIEEASAAMEQMLGMNDLRLEEQPLEAANPAADSPMNHDLGIDIDDEEEAFGKSPKVLEVFGSMERDNVVAGVLQRQTSLKGCGKLMEILNNYSSPFLNFICKEKSYNERSHESASARWRKCKRSAIFDSRRIVLFFSILSSLGTLVLIYMTLRVRQAAESFVTGG